MRLAVVILTAALTLWWLTRLRTCPDLAEDCWQPWRDCYPDRLEDIWMSYYERSHV